MLKLRLLFILIFTLTSSHAFAWNDETTHKLLSIKSAEHSLSNYKIDYLKNIGIYNQMDEIYKCNGVSKEIYNWIKAGAELEDAQDTFFPLSGTTRSFGHFHDPTKPWDQSGLSDIYTGESTVLWSQDGSSQQEIVEGDWSWQMVREYYYAAFISENDADRQINFAKTFRGLGHQMHLLQDMAVPDHVRNDAHAEDAIFGKNLSGTYYFEAWTKEQFNYVNSLAATPVFPDISFNISYNNLAPTTQLFDAEQYNMTNPSTAVTQGLSEYTNANFFSGDTIFSYERYSTNNIHYFPYPKKTSTDLQNYLNGTKPVETVTAEDGSPDTGIWISKNSDGEIINHFIRPGYLTKNLHTLFGEGELFYSSFYRDEICHADYLEKLIPRAVGYSAALLNYFFRGKINIIRTGADTFRIINLSDEKLEGDLNSFRLFYDDADSTRIEIPLAFYDEYGAEYTEPGTILLIPANSESSFTVQQLDTPQNPKTAGEYMLVFKGRLGAEGIAPYDNSYAVTAQLITPHFLVHAVSNDSLELFDQWDIYEYDLLGNRIFNVTGHLPRGIAYHHAIPNPADPETILFQIDTACPENPADWTVCTKILKRSTGEIITAEWIRVPWWSKDGQRIYGVDGGYFDMASDAFVPDSPWNAIDQFCDYGYTVSPSLSYDESMLAIEGSNPFYSPARVDSIIYSTTGSSAITSDIIDMNSMTLAITDNQNICTDYLNDEIFFETTPDFHPYENSIVFASDANGPFDIYRTDYSSRTIEKLTNASPEDTGFYQPAWSSDGNMIIMAGKKQGEASEIYMIPSSGITLEKITEEETQLYYPRWITYQ